MKLLSSFDSISVLFLWLTEFAYINSLLSVKLRTDGLYGAIVGKDIMDNLKTLDKQDILEKCTRVYVFYLQHYLSARQILHGIHLYVSYFSIYRFYIE